MNTIGVVEAFWRDLRHGLRLLRLHPAFTLTATLSLALGMGANSAIFQLLNAVRLRSLPVERPQELAEIRLAPPRSRSGRWDRAEARTVWYRRVGCPRIRSPRGSGP